MIDLLEYETSLLNPFLKFLACIIFLIIAGIFLDIRRKFGGNIKIFINYLFFSSLFIAIAFLLRFFGHGIDFGFSPEYSLKWFQSLAYLIGAVFLILAGRTLVTLFDRGSS